MFNESMTISGMVNYPIHFQFHSRDDEYFFETTVSGMRVHMPEHPRSGLHVLAYTQQIIVQEPRDTISMLEHYGLPAQRKAASLTVESDRIVYDQFRSECFWTTRGKLPEFAKLLLDFSQRRISRLSDELEKRNYNRNTFHGHKKQFNEWFRKVSGREVDALHSDNGINCMLDRQIQVHDMRGVTR